MTTLVVQDGGTLLETVTRAESIESVEEGALIETPSDQVVIDSEGHTEIFEVDTPTLIETPISSGPRGGIGPEGPPGPEGRVSKAANNRLTRKEDGLYVLDDLMPDPLAHYTLARG